MVKVDLNSDKWTSEDVIAYKETVGPPLGITSITLTVVSLVIFYSFPKMRKFPASMLSWVSYYNLLFSAYVIWRWTPGSALLDPWGANLVANSFPCRAGLFIDTFAMHGVIAANTLLALTIFLSVQFLISVDQQKAYHYYYLTFVVVYPAAISLYSALGFSTQVVSGNCTVESEHINDLNYPFVFLLWAQMSLYSYSLYKMRATLRGVNTNVVQNVSANLSYLTIRFIALFVAEIYNCVPNQIHKTLYYLNLPARFVRFAIVSRESGPILDALILIAGNTEFRIWVGRKASSLRRRHHLRTGPHQPSTHPLVLEPTGSSASPAPERVSSYLELLSLTAPVDTDAKTPSTVDSA